MQLIVTSANGSTSEASSQAYFIIVRGKHQVDAVIKS